jgi:hypothetical protein
MYPVGGAAGVRDRVVRHPDQDAHVPRLVHRPLGERAVAQVEAGQDLLGDQPGQLVHGVRVAVPRAVGAPRQHALDVEGLVGDVPLDRQVYRRDGGGEPADLPGHEVREARRRDRVVGREVGVQPAQRADRERQPHLESHVVRDDAVRTQFPEDLVGGDRVVHARPGVPVHRGRARPDPEDRCLVHVPRSPGRRVGLLDRLNVRVRAHEAFPLVAHPRRPRPRLAVRQGEHQAGAGEVHRGCAQRVLGRRGGDAAHQ